MIQLGVNIDHIATLRQARGGSEPRVLEAAHIVESAGADSITVHLREDRRHIQDEDVYQLRKEIKSRLNLEMALNEEIIAIALRIVPDQITLVPEKRRELTTEGGLDVIAGERRIERALGRFKKKGIRVSLFINPTIKVIKKAASIGVDAIEVHTGKYAESFKKGQHRLQLQKLCDSALVAHQHGLQVNAGHGLDYENIKPICNIPHLEEVNIGHSIISKAVTICISSAVVEMKNQIARGRALCLHRPLKKK